jgi:hypothetical protein
MDMNAARISAPRSIGAVSRQVKQMTRRSEIRRVDIVPAMEDLGVPSSYLALEPGIPVYSSDDRKLGELHSVLADDEEDVFDGIVIDSSALPGGLQFADASQVAGIYERGVILALSIADAERLPEPSENPGMLEVTGVEDVDRSELHEKLRRAWEIVSGGGSEKR